jgi:dimethylpropiothetin dethiomethylase
MRRLLEEHPDIAYYLLDLLAFYRQASSGGSKAIRAHMKAVRVALNAALEADPEARRDEPETRPACRHLERAVDNGVRGPAEVMVRGFSRFAHALRWGWGYERMPDRLKRCYAYAEILGPGGPVPAETLIAGVVLLAPGTHYPVHSHQDLAESYLCLSGALSQNDAGVAVPGSLLYNPPGHRHRLTVDRRDPCLLSYVWIGPREAIMHQEMSFSWG